VSARYVRGIARFDSSTCMAQALALFLHGRDVATLSGSRWLDMAMPAINLLPNYPREWIYSIGGMSEAITAAQVPHIDFDGIAQWIVEAFPQRSYPAAFIGSSNGALVHLAAAIGAPWLPQTYLCPVRRLTSDPDDAQGEFARGRPIVEAFLKADPHVAVHHMHDPNQDRLMLRTMSYFRLKHRALPRHYRDFLLRSLPRGATLYVSECTRSWPVTRTSERSVYQFGAVGGLKSDEYFRGGEGVREYFARYGVARTRWDPPMPNDVAPEAEWGFDSALSDELVDLAQSQDWRLVRFSFEDPEAMSFVTAEIHREWYRDIGCEPTRLIVENFVLQDPYRALRLRAVPFWLVFCVERSAAVLREFLDGEPAYDEIGLMLFSHGTEGAGVAPIAEWRELLSRARRSGYFLGVDEARFPRDFATFIRFHRALAELGTPFDLPPPLSLRRFEELVRQHGPRRGIRVQDHTQPVATG
jgi:hypothetical protein